MNKQLSHPRVAVIIPCYNEEGSLVALLDRLAEVRNKLDVYHLDVILVNDGSLDKTQNIIDDLAHQHQFVKYRQLSGNVGHQSALRAGLDAAVGYDAAIMMDGDLQHPPACIPKMLNTWQQTGANIVQMVRNDSSKEAGFLKYWTSRAYYRILNALSGLNLEYGSSDFRLIDAATIVETAKSPEQNLFLRGYFSWLPVVRTSLTYSPDKRFSGESKYTFRKMLGLARAGILQFSEKPLRLATNLGLVIAFLSVVYGLFLILSYFVGEQAVSGWTSLMVVMLFCFGINFILIGFIGRYLAHGISLQKHRPDYVVKNERL
jgi:dolichol-phosphate mannosyltransferase